ncbi:peptidoglycan DD-metalloendopeptidase family protein [Salinicola halimionae]|uniref:peptidoglycan DD-metalloendopeptidase family protein n=1 Tax=Salinicola halimionae TaxID=1949081 RepID=UPI001FD96B58|nr:peptidoglycan DD-metalloendopeptidase family protein [Salinicola halimionae]
MRRIAGIYRYFVTKKEFPMSKRRTALLLGLLPIVAVGLNACTTSSGRPQVQDLSVSRNSDTNSTYTVKGGDTIYGIAWQNRVDFRDLAQLNGISPPYRLEPGQQLKLKSGASVSGGQVVASSGGVTATGLGAAGSDTNSSSTAGEGDNPSWLLPSDSETPSSEVAQRGGQAASGSASSSAPKPVNTQNDGRTVAQNGSQNGSQQSKPATSAGSNAGAGQVGRSPGASAATAADTGSSSSSASMNRNSTKTASGNDAGTEVAGEPSGAPDRSDRTYKPVENVPWQWPTSGQIVGKFDGDSNITPGIDIAGQKGQPVKAAGPGIVVYAGDGVRGYGNLIILKHNDRFLSAYAHNDSLKVKENDVVEAGETIATMGQTDADQVELHFEVRVNGQPQDPLKYLPAR